MYYFKIKSVLFLMQVSVYVDLLVSCPLKSSHPCYCDGDYDHGNFVVVCENKNTTLEEVKESLLVFGDELLNDVQLIGLKLGVVPADFFQGVHIFYLTISECELESLSGSGGKPLEGLERSINKLIIESSFKEYDTPVKLSLSHLKQIAVIDLEGNSIEVLGDDWFQDAPTSFRRLTLSNNKIITIGKRAFADIKNLNHLRLSNNRFGEITRSMLPNPAKLLEELYLDDNGLKRLPGDMFTNMPKLLVVDLSNNGLTVISENVWKNVWGKLDRVLSIRLLGNPLICDDDMYWMLRTPTLAEIEGKCKYPRRSRGKDIPFIRRIGFGEV